jgi:hypothetical protein
MFALVLVLVLEQNTILETNTDSAGWDQCVLDSRKFGSIENAMNDPIVIAWQRYSSQGSRVKIL